MRAAFVAITVAILPVACSLGALDGFSGGPNDALDAAPDTNVASETSTEDSGGGGPDGATDADAAAKTFCASLTDPVLLCVDFENGLPLGFKTKEISSTAKVDDQGKDGTKGFTVDVPANAPQSAEACTSITLPGPRTKLVVEADVRFSAAGTTNYDVLNLYTGNNQELGISVTGTTFFIEEERAADGGSELTTASTGSAKNTFQRLRFVATVDAQVAHTELFIDGVSVAKHDALASNVNGAVQFQIGDCSLVGAKGWTANYDNVVLIETKN